MKILDKLWFTEISSNNSVIGIIIIENDHGERKAYIGTRAGYNEHGDVARIISRGATLNINHARRIITLLSKTKGE